MKVKDIFAPGKAFFLFVIFTTVVVASDPQTWTWSPQQKKIFQNSISHTTNHTTTSGHQVFAERYATQRGWSSSAIYYTQVINANGVPFHFQLNYVGDYPNGSFVAHAISPNDWVEGGFLEEFSRDSSMVYTSWRHATGADTGNMEISATSVATMRRIDPSGYEYTVTVTILPPAPPPDEDTEVH